MYRNGPSTLASAMRNLKSAEMYTSQRASAWQLSCSITWPNLPCFPDHDDVSVLLGRRTWQLHCWMVKYQPYMWLKWDETAHSAVSNILHLLLINITDSSKKANILNNFFHSVFSPAEPAPPAVPLSPTTGVTLTSIQLSVLKWLKLWKTWTPRKLANLGCFWRPQLWRLHHPSAVCSTCRSPWAQSLLVGNALMLLQCLKRTTLPLLWTTGPSHCYALSRRF